MRASHAPGWEGLRVGTTTQAPPQRTAAGGAYLRLVLLAALVGIPAALIAALFLAAVSDLQHVLWHDLPDALDASSPPWYLVVALPVVGAGIVLFARKLLPGDGGESPFVGLKALPTPLRFIPGIALAAIGTLAFGAVLGPEAPVVALGMAIGGAPMLFVKLESRAGMVVSSAGAFSAVSALFGGPLVAGMLLLESGIGLGAALLPALLPGLVAAAVGYLIFVGFGHWSGLNAPGLREPDLPAYTGVHLGDLVIALIVGVLTAALLLGVRRLGRLVDARGRPALRVPGLLLLGGLVVGLLAEVADLLGANSQNVLFSGQVSVPDIVTAGSTKIILVTLVAKAIGYAVSLGCGFRGGPIFPAIFTGIAIASLPIVWFHTSPTLAIAIGAAAGMASQTRLLIAPLLFAALLVGTGGTDTIPAAVFATVAAWLTTAALDPPTASAQSPAPAARSQQK
jgi:H+/Cl- antiporter ClcA